MKEYKMKEYEMKKNEMKEFGFFNLTTEEYEEFNETSSGYLFCDLCEIINKHKILLSDNVLEIMIGALYDNKKSWYSCAEILKRHFFHISTIFFDKLLKLDDYPFIAIKLFNKSLTKQMNNSKITYHSKLDYKKLNKKYNLTNVLDNQSLFELVDKETYKLYLIRELGDCYIKNSDNSDDITFLEEALYDLIKLSTMPIPQSQHVN